MVGTSNLGSWNGHWIDFFPHFNHSSKFRMSSAYFSNQEPLDAMRRHSQVWMEAKAKARSSKPRSSGDSLVVILW